MDAYRVFSAFLPPEKCWYFLHTGLLGIKPNKVRAQSIFQTFEGEIKTLNANQLFDHQGLPLTQSTWYRRHCRNADGQVIVISTLGVVTSILKHRDPKLLTETQFEQVLEKINGEDIGVSRDRSMSYNSTSLLLDLDQQLKSKAAQLNTVEKTLESYRKKLEILQSEVNNYRYAVDDVAPDFDICDSCTEIFESTELDFLTKKQLISKKSGGIFRSLKDVSERHRETVSSVLGHAIAFSADPDATDLLSEIVDVVVEHKGIKQTVEKKIFSEKTHAEFLQTMRVPDWVLLYFKLAARVPDKSWQTLLNLTKLGDTGRSSDAGIMLTKNKLKAVKKMVFSISREAMKVKDLPNPLTGSQVDLEAVLTWMIRNLRLHKADSEELEANIKLDGRPFWGKDQVMVGIVPINSSCYKEQSAKSVYPIALANCKEDRTSLCRLLQDFNKQKSKLKSTGICVDGKTYRIKFTVTLDYKALLLLMVKVGDDSFVLGGKGFDKEFCIFCLAIRRCKCPGVDVNEVCLTCFAKSKADIGKWKGIRDDLVFLMEEDLSDVNLCALHMEMRNTEQIIGSLGLFAHKCGTLQELNTKLSSLGPENFKQNYVKIKESKNKGTAVNRQNIKVSSMSGPTERKFLDNIESIVSAALPCEKVTSFYHDRSNAETFLLNNITFMGQMQKFFADILATGHFERDYGTHQTNHPISVSENPGKFIAQQQQFWLQKQQRLEEVLSGLCDLSQEKELVEYAASLQIEMFHMMTSEWKSIALTIRDRVFENNADGDCEIDVFDIQCKQWGFLLRHLFGLLLGTGDYGHLTVEHVPMLFRRHRSLCRYANQGFEAAHKLQRQLYSRGTNHDFEGSGSSNLQILTHHYSEKFLELRYSFREAQKCAMKGTAFYFRGCGWAKKVMAWSDADIEWISTMNKLFDSIFGDDHFSFEQTESKDCIISPSSQPAFQYDHDEWEKNIQRELNETPESEPPAKIPKVMKEVKVKRSLNMNQPGLVSLTTPTESPISPSSPSLSDVSQSASSNLHFFPSSRNHIRIPRVPPWGGECILEDTGARITLTNTCPVDNFLTMFFFLLKEREDLFTLLTKRSDECVKALLNAMRFFEKGEFARGKVEWLRQFDQFDFGRSGCVNVWGNEFDLFWKLLAALHPSEISSRCSSSSCPKSNDSSSVTGIFIQETTQLKPGETYLESSLSEWMTPQPSPCGKEFTGNIPPGVRPVRGVARLDLSTNTFVTPMLCDGVRYVSRTFPHGQPFALFLSLYHFSSNGIITEPQQLPPEITIDGQAYDLTGCTFWNGLHYSSCLKYKTHWFSYDGLMESKAKGSGLQPSSWTTLLPRRYWLSSCVYVLK